MITLTSLALLPLAGCDGGLDAPLDGQAEAGSFFDVPNVVDYEAPAEAVTAANPVLEEDDDIRVPAELPELSQPGASGGWFTFELLHSTCEGGSDYTWQSAWYGDVWMASGEIDINLPMFPLLSGDLDDRESFVTGVVTWMDTAGFDVLCEVEGSASVERDGIDGEVTETLSSTGPTNCETTVGFHFEPDPLTP